jgi:mannose-6-phosphate isomerase-like protein (cupin superfamily)
VATGLDANGRVVVSISDTGSGIPADVRPRLFTPFFTTKPVGVGTGLGLAISHRIISQLGGELTFETEVGKGTEFKVTLPLAIGPAPRRASQRHTLQPPVRRGKVLVIDDEEALATAIKRYLSTDHEVTAVYSASAALDLFESGARYDVILCDLMMPQITGMELHTEVARIDPSQANRFVFLTGGAFTSFASVDVERPNAGEKVNPMRSGRITVGRFTGVVSAANTIGYGRWGAGSSLSETMAVDDIMIVLKGRLSVTTEDGTVSAGPGEIVYMPKGEKVTIHAGEEDAVTAYVTYPHWREAQG